MKTSKNTEPISNDDKDSLKIYYKEIKNTGPLSVEQEAELAKRIHNGDEKALDTLINANLKFVVYVAKQYQHIGLPLEDLINEGNIGLITAANKFDGTQGCKFISYAVWWIRESILQALAKDGRTIRLPMNQVELIGKINKTISEFESEHGRTPTENEIADILNTIDTKVSRAINDSKQCISIDTTFSEDDDRTVLDTYKIPDSADSDSKLVDDSIYSELRRLLSVIPPNEQYILGHFFGLGYDKMTLDEIAEKMKKPRARIQQIKEKGIRHLRERTKSKTLKQFLENL